MFENLQKLVKEHAGDAIINNPAIPNEKNDEAVATASNSIINGLKQSVSNGNTGDLMNMFNGGEHAVAQSPVAQKIQGNFVQDLMQKFGLDQSKAASIGSSLIPMVLKKFTGKTNDANDSSFDLTSILGSLTGGAGIGGKDILSNLGGGNNSSNNEDGGLLGKVKGLF